MSLLLLGAGKVRSSAFAPADLFAGAIGGGAWIANNSEFSGFAAATAIDAWTDIVNSHTVVGATTARPTKETQSGAVCARFDGTNDILTMASSLGMYAAGSCSWFARVKTTAATTDRLASGGYSAGDNPGYDLLHCNNTTASSVGAFIKNDTSVQLMDATTVIATNFWDGTLRNLGMIDSGTTMTPYIAGTGGTPVAYTAARSGTVTQDQFAIGGLYRNQDGTPASNWMQMDLYALVICNKVLSAGEIASLDTWLTALGGS